MCLCSILWHQAESVRGQRSLDKVKGVDGLFWHCLRHRIQFDREEPGCHVMCAGECWAPLAQCIMGVFGLEMLTDYKFLHVF